MHRENRLMIACILGQVTVTIEYLPLDLITPLRILNHR